MYNKNYCKSLNFFLTKIKNKARISTVITYIEHLLKILEGKFRQEKETSRDIKEVKIIIYLKIIYIL